MVCAGTPLDIEQPPLGDIALPKFIASRHGDLRLESAEDPFEDFEDDDFDDDFDDVFEEDWEYDLTEDEEFPDTFGGEEPDGPAEEGDEEASPFSDDPDFDD